MTSSATHTTRATVSRTSTSPLPGDHRVGRPRLSQAYVDDLANKTGKQLLISDAELGGFCLRVHPSGRKIYCVRCRVSGRVRHYTIGAAGSPWTADEARVKAREIMLAVSWGRDPATEKQQTFGGMTVSLLIRRYLSDGPATRLEKRASTWKLDEANLIHHVEPLIGKMRIHNVRRADVARMAGEIMSGATARVVRTKARGIARVRGGVGTARRTVTTTGAMFAWAIEQELLASNPVQRIKLPKLAARERFLSEAEAKHLLATLDAMAASKVLHMRFANQIRLLLFTGARKSEILALQWSEIDWTRQQIVLPPNRTKTGGRVGDRRIPLSSAALGVLKAIEQENEWVFPAGRKMSGYAKGLQKVWCQIRQTAGLGQMRVHDLRHSFASLALSKNESIFLISKVLGHTTTRMTERYLHTNDQDLQNMVQRTTTELGW